MRRRHEDIAPGGCAVARRVCAAAVGCCGTRLPPDGGERSDRMTNVIGEVLALLVFGGIPGPQEQ
ncbi:MAG: hypothetical protein ABI629_08270, partial [bacterium]